MNSGDRRVQRIFLFVLVLAVSALALCACGGPKEDPATVKRVVMP